MGNIGISIFFFGGGLKPIYMTTGSFTNVS